MVLAALIPGPEVRLIRFHGRVRPQQQTAQAGLSGWY